MVQLSKHWDPHVNPLRRNGTTSNTKVYSHKRCELKLADYSCRNTVTLKAPTIETTSES